MDVVILTGVGEAGVVATAEDGGATGMSGVEVLLALVEEGRVRALDVDGSWPGEQSNLTS